MNKTVLITGASSGIGEATAKIFASNHWNVVLTARRKERLEKLAKMLSQEFQVQAEVLAFDISKRNETEKALSILQGKDINIDVLVNNAGLALGLKPLHEGLTDDWDKMIDVNIKGVLFVSRCIIPQMIQRKAGHIINIGSVAGRDVYVNGNVYCATKFAVDALTKGMRAELLPYGIKVSQIAPGATETEFSEVRFKGDKEAAQNVYKGFKPLTGSDIANIVYFTATLPPHVNINDLLVMPVAQANAFYLNRDSK